MKKFINKINVAIMLAFVMLAVACQKKDVLPFLKRQGDGMQFTYLNTTKDFSILAKGSWKVASTDDWINFANAEGNGNGKDEQQLKVSVSQNTGGARTGSFVISNAEKSYEVTVTQEDGNLVLSRPTMASGFTINQSLGDENVHIPYTKGAISDKANVTASLQGPGAAGLTISNVNDYDLSAGDGSIPVSISGTPTTLGEIEVTLNVSIPSRSYTETFVVKSRTRDVNSGVDPLESPTVTLFKVLPRLAILDWGTYVENSGVSRKFILELALAQYGPSIRRYANQVDWTSTTSITTGMFHKNNRFAFGDLLPGTTYWFRITHVSNNTALNLNSDMTYFSFTTPAEPTLSSNVILYKDFDNFWFGGSPIYQAFGVQPTEAQVKTIDPTSSTVKATDYRTFQPNGNLSSTFDGALSPSAAPGVWSAYWEGAKYGSSPSATYNGWFGVNALAATGAVRLGTASAQGYLQTPKLTDLGNTPTNITLEVNTAAYFEPFHTWGEDYLNHIIEISGDGVIVDGGSTLVTQDNNQKITVACRSNVNASTRGPLNSYTIPTKHTVKITGATQNTRAIIRSFPYGGASHYRIWLDDIKITKD